MTMNRSEGALLAGVCAGIARAFDWNVWVLRALFVAFLLIETFWAAIAYAALALFFHFSNGHKENTGREEGLTSPELSERGRRIEELEKRFRDLEKN